MSELDRYNVSRGQLLTGNVNRAVARVEGGAHVAVARVQAEATVRAAQVDAVASVTQRGLQATAFFTQVEQQLSQAVPLAASRLQAIGDIGALGLAQVVMDAANDVRRI
jgi:hypothetical protein